MKYIDIDGKIIYDDKYAGKEIIFKIKELVKEIRTVTDKECEINNMKPSILRIANRLEDIIKNK
tara:strand:- start:426 stop:617 length:192 start_codon:yes stop_codon:yes gene_type:complete